MPLNVLQGDRSKDQVDMKDGRENGMALVFSLGGKKEQKTEQKTFSAI